MFPTADEDSSKHKRSDQQTAEQDLESQAEIFNQIFPSQAQTQGGLTRRLWAKQDILLDISKDFPLTLRCVFDRASTYQHVGGWQKCSESLKFSKWE